MNTPSDKPRRPLSYRARAVAHEWGRAEGVFHCSAPHDELGIVHDHRCDSLADAITFAIERDRAERAGTGATRLRDVPGLVDEIMEAIYDASGNDGYWHRAALSAIAVVERHLTKATPAAPAAEDEAVAKYWIARHTDPGRCAATMAKGRCERAIGHDGPHETRNGSYSWTAPPAPAVEAGPPKVEPGQVCKCATPILDSRDGGQTWTCMACGGHDADPSPPRDWAKEARDLLDRKVQHHDGRTCDCYVCAWLCEYDEVHAAHGAGKGGAR